MVTGIHVSVPAILAAGAGVILLYIVWRGWPFERYPGAMTWTLILISVAVWDISYGIALTVHDPGLRWWFEIPINFGRSVSIPLILTFALQYTGRERLATSYWMYGLFTFYGTAFLLTITNPLHHLMWTGYQISPIFGAAAVDFTPRGYYVVAGASYLVILLAIVTLIDTIARQRELFGRQGLALVVALAIPSIANVVWMFRLGPTRHLDLTPIGHIFIASLLTYALFQKDMFEVAPATRHKAEQAALDDLAVAVISVTTNGQIVNVNARAADLFDFDSESLLLSEISDYLPIQLPLDETTFTLSDPFGRRNEYTVGISEIVSDRGNSIGYTISLQDITAERRRQQRLQVLNRVLRHNLRNDLNLVLGYADELDEETPGRSAKAELIDDTVSNLLAISQKARKVEEIVAREGDGATAELATVVESAVQDVTTEYADCRFDVRSPETGSTVNKRILFPVVRELTENACRHNDAAEPVVSVVADVIEGAEYPISIRISDNGPGIPDEELQPLHEGTETPLEHGSGLGLWLIEWGVSRLGGTITFEENDPRGTVVDLRLPGTETDEATGP
ncbi:MAG: histidine kinase N-terminal 7TM domain-containing protein [Halobacteriales archaeon]